MENFLDIVVDEPCDTSYFTVPEGHYPAYVKDIKFDTIGNKPALSVQWIITDPEIIELSGNPEPLIRQTVWLDLTEMGGLDTGKGKNRQLGLLREAAGQNVTGKPWSPSQLLGINAVVQVVHSLRNGETFANVKGVFPPAAG